MQDFAQLYAQYYMRVYKFVLSMCRDPALAEEITQDSFFKAYQNIDRFKGECSISSWLCQIAKNSYYSHLKRSRKRQPLPSGDTSIDVEARLLEKEAAYGVHKTLHKLREPYKEVFWLKAFGELSFREIGELFDKSESWARVTYYRAKIKIREELE